MPIQLSRITGPSFDPLRKRWMVDTQIMGKRIKKQFLDKEAAESWFAAVCVPLLAEQQSLHEEARKIANEKRCMDNMDEKRREAASKRRKEKYYKEKEENPELLREKHRLWAKTWHNNNLDKVRESQNKRRKTENGRARRQAYNNRRKMNKIQRVPTWAWDEVNQREKDLRKEIALLTQETGLVYNIDHIVPLRAATRLQDGTLLYLASGLHVPDNLQILEAGENLAKSCWDWPDRWDYTETDINELEVLHERVTTQPHRGLAHARTDAERSSGDGGTRIKELGEHA